MNPGVAPYIGLVVAVLILLWGVLVLSGRYLRRQQLDSKKMDIWVPLAPTSGDEIESSHLEEGEQPSQPYNKARQNGHYSKSQKGQ